MRKLLSALLAAGMVVFTTGCAVTAQYGQGDENGTPVWLTVFADREDAIATAQDHCAKYGKVPAEKTRAEWRIDFACVAPGEMRRVAQLVPIATEALAGLRGAPKIYAVHYQYPPLLVDPPRQPRGVVNPGVADSTISTGGGLLPFLFGLAIDEFAISRQEDEANRFPQQVQASEQRGTQLIKDLALVDPIVAVKAYVLLALQEAGLRNIRDVGEPFDSRIGAGQLKEDLLEGVILEFGTQEWILRTGATRTINFIAYGRLRRLEDDSPLWAAECHQPPQPLPAFSKRDQGSNEHGATLKAKLRDLAEECATGLSASLLTNKNDQR